METLDEKIIVIYLPSVRNYYIYIPKLHIHCIDVYFTVVYKVPHGSISAISWVSTGIF